KIVRLPPPLPVFRACVQACETAARLNTTETFGTSSLSG
ncbi:unnamed protein product, partial [Laminaria digitata]